MFDDETQTHIPEEIEPYLYQVGEVVDGRYLVRSMLGRGGMGAVLRVENQTTREPLALKYCKPGQNAKRFAREVRIMEGVESLHIIPIVGSNLEHNPPYFVMPLAERSLESGLAELAGDEPTALEVFRQICLGVMDLHSLKIYHRDLKPANVLRPADGRMVVCDLGLARSESRDSTVLTRTIGFLGTEGYLAPEQRQPDGSRNSDARTDVYQLGKVLYQLLTGKHPRLVDYSSLPGGLTHIIKKATAEDPGDRYQSVEKLEVALSAYRSSKDPLQNPREVLEHLVCRLEQSHPGGVPTREDLENVLEILAHGGWLEQSLVIESFHRVPDGWLLTMTREHEPLLYTVLICYAKAIHERIAGYEYAFADKVAASMKIVYENTEVARTKVTALRALMSAADKLNRFSTQRAFCLYLEAIKTIDLALPVAEMLSDHGRPQLKSFISFNVEVYHPAIRDALLAVLIEPEAERQASPDETSGSPSKVSQSEYEEDGARSVDAADGSLDAPWEDQAAPLANASKQAGTE